MAFVIQNEDGTQVGANAYVSVAEFRAYQTDRGTATNTYSDAQVEAALIKATDYIDSRFRYVGQSHQKDQTTAWPRYGARDSNGWYINGIHPAVKRVTHEYAMRALIGQLYIDPQRDASGRIIKRESKQVGPLRKDVEYDVQSGITEAGLPHFPAADLILRRAGLTMSGSVPIGRA